MKTLEQFKPFIVPILTAIATMALAWGSFSAKIDAQENRINEINITHDKLSETLTQLRIDTSSIKANQETMKDDIAFIKNKVR